MDTTEKAKEALKILLEKEIDIHITYRGIKRVDKVYLPKNRREFIVDQLASTIKDKNDISIEVYVGGNNFTADKLIDRINEISKKHNVSTKEIKVCEDIDQNNHIIFSFKKPYTEIKIDELANRAYEREVRKYKNDYETAERINKTKELVK